MSDDPDKTARWNAPATRVELAFIAAETSLALRHIMLAMYAIRRGDDAAVDDYIKTITKQADDLWATFKQMTD